MRKIINSIIEKIQNWKAKRRREKMLKEARKRDPFIYD